MYRSCRPCVARAGVGVGVRGRVGLGAQVVQAAAPYLGALADVDVVELLDEVLE